MSHKMLRPRIVKMPVLQHTHIYIYIYIYINSYDIIINMTYYVTKTNTQTPANIYYYHNCKLENALFQKLLKYG